MAEAPANVKTEQDLYLGEEATQLRAKLIKEWDANSQRKDDAFKAYECLKDKTVNYVLDLLTKQFDTSTVIEMQYAMSNVSILRKVIDKLAKVYANGVKRTMPEPEKPANAKPKALPAPTDPASPPTDPNADPNAPPPPPAVIPSSPVDPNDPSKGMIPAKVTAPPPKVETQADLDTKVIEQLADILDFDAAMKKTNRYFRAFWNTLVYVKPLSVDDKFTIKLEVKPPFSYDVVEDPKNPALPLAVICSDYVPTRQTLYALGDVAAAGRTVGVVRDVKPPQVSKLSREMENDTREYIWWTKSYHFTTNVKGEILQDKTPDGGVNPILALPFVNFAGEQDMCFWAEGGGDLVDAGVKINTLITHVNHVAITQGYGQLYMTGKNLPKSQKVGPNHCIQLAQEEGEPAPTVGFINSNPPLQDLQSLIEMGVALMLSTNNLSTSGFSTSLKGGSKDMASGVALMIDKSESIEDIGEQSLIFVKKEPQVWTLVGKWHEVYRARGLLIDALKVIKVPKNLDKIQLKFPSPKPIISESDELDVLQKRKDMGLNTEVELIMRDDPSLSEDEAEAKIAKIKAEKQANAAAFGVPTDPNAPTDGGPNGNQSKGGGGGFGQNGNKPGTNQGPQGNPGANQNPNQK